MRIKNLGRPGGRSHQTQLFLVLGLASIGCHANGLSLSENEEVSSQASALSTPLAVVLPSTVAVQTAALGATDKLTLADRVQVRTPEGAPALISNMGSQETNLGMEANTGSVWSKGNVVLRGTNVKDFINVLGDVWTQGTTTRQNNAKVRGTIYEHQTITTQSTPFVVDWPAPVNTSKSYGPGGAATLQPGNYGDVQVYQGAVLTLLPGNYFFTNFKLEPGARLILKNDSEPVFVYIRNLFQPRAAIEEKAQGELKGNAFFAVSGTTAVVVETPFIGTLIAPQAALTLATVGTAGHNGAFFAKTIEVRPDVVITHRPFRSVLINNVGVSKPEVCVGEPVKVTVTPRPGVSPTVSIDMQVANERTFQFTGVPGKRLITVIASDLKGMIDVRTVQVNVIDCGTSYASAIVVARPSVDQPYTAELRVLNAADLPGTNRIFRWDFGDGTPATDTTYPFVEHSYEDSLGPDAEYKIFTATLRLLRDGLADIVVQKTITVWNHYAFVKKRGVIAPRADAPAKATVAGSVISTTLTIRNRETSALTLTQETVERRFCDPERDPETLPVRTISLVVPASGTATRVVEADSTLFGNDVCGMAVTLRGQAGSLTVIANQQVDVRPNTMFRRQVADSATAALLKNLRTQGLAGPGGVITDRDLARLYKQGRIPSLPRTQDMLGPGALGDAPDVIDQLCVPGDDPPRPGLSCQVVDEPDICYPAFLKNAQKGDLLLVAACGDIGGLLRNVDPPQHYSHEGIMTQNWMRVSHSTRYTEEVTKKMEDDHEWSGDFLRYGKPGALHQSIAASFAEGEFSQDTTRCPGDATMNPPLIVKPFPGTEPQSRPKIKAAADIAKSIESHYRFFAYSEANVGENASYDVPASLVSSTGESGPATVSSQFIWLALKKAGITLEGTHEAGERGADAQTEDGLYVYTERERSVAGTWLYNHVFNMILENAPSAIRFLAEGIATDAGMQMVGCFAKDKCSLNDICNNCDFFKRSAAFFDLVSAPGVGHAVAPDDFFSWDPAPVGVYGYSEIMAYRAGECMPATRWKEAPNTGTLQVHVHDETGPAGGALVMVDGAEVRTDAAGDVTIRGVSAGNQLVLVQCGKPVAGTPSQVGCDAASTTLLSNSKTVTVPADVTTAVDIALLANSQSARKVTFDYTVWLNDDDFGKSDDCDTWGFSRGGCNQRSSTLVHGECEVDPYEPIQPPPDPNYPKPSDPLFGRTFGDWFPPASYPQVYTPFKTLFNECAHSEVRGQLSVRCELLPGAPADRGKVHVQMVASLSEGTSCGGDPVGQELLEFDLAPGETRVDGFLREEDASNPTNGSPYDRIEVRWNASDGAGIHNGTQF